MTTLPHDLARCPKCSGRLFEETDEGITERFCLAGHRFAAPGFEVETRRRDHLPGLDKRRRRAGR
jgi:hypothetical protein